ncbi:geranylgeranyl diphosphate synthase IdsB [Mycobacterium riyadhense]|uniref:(2E,6E)-farnesyl diphosphate synthase n=1 Tax=Mycobacterium riyadhense TaxID=486698 RepID=A0A653F4P6_9MYCO|nr:geranylgeranyl diphosphate synthase IdsB [Mycobacterium riyadhense]VTP04131.1 (2E,6E)-farnesyl diphosphate synthase [Mycobacterium riyadhense]
MPLEATKPRNAPAHSGIEILARAQRNCDPLLRAAVVSLPEPLATMGGYHFGWWDPERSSTSATQGKFVRAALTFATAAVCDGSEESAAPAAAAMELLHNFTLIHDDVMDRDKTRRGRATAWNVWGITSAILLGDALHSLAIQLLAETDLMEQSLALSIISRIEKSCLKLCLGQFQDCAFEGQVAVTVDEYLQMAGAKTASLMGTACALGALSARADDQTVSTMERFGYQLGLAFQAVDDVIGIWGDATNMGKPVGSDLVRRKATLPVVAALNSNCDASTELRELYRSESPTTYRDVARAIALIEAAGGREAAKHHAEERLRAAIALLPEVPAAAELIALSQVVVDRSR